MKIQKFMTTCRVCDVCVCVCGMGEWAAHAFPVRVKNIHSLND